MEYKEIAKMSIASVSSNLVKRPVKVFDAKNAYIPKVELFIWKVALKQPTKMGIVTQLYTVEAKNYSHAVELGKIAWDEKWGTGWRNSEMTFICIREDINAQI